MYDTETQKKRNVIVDTHIKETSTKTTRDRGNGEGEAAGERPRDVR